MQMFVLILTLNLLFFFKDPLGFFFLLVKNQRYVECHFLKIKFKLYYYVNSPNFMNLTE